MKNLNVPNFVDSFALAKKSFLFLNENKDLNLFPLLNILVVTFLGLLIYLLFPNEGAIRNNLSGFFAYALGAYLIFAFLISYLDTALMSIVLKRLNHEKAGLNSGFKQANQLWFSILQWSMFTATIGWLLKFSENIQNIAKKLFGYSISFSWSIAAYFVLPILITEKINPFKAMQRSLKTVGQGYKNTVSVRLLVTMCFIFIFFIISEFITSYPLITTYLLIRLLPLFLIAYFVAEALETVLVSALFLNLARLRSPKHFDPTLLARAFAKDE